MRPPPRPRLAWMAALLTLVAAAAAHAGGEAPVVLDVTPPVLTAFDAGTSLNTAKATPPFSVLVKASDDLSGVRSILFWATGPSGQRIPALVELAYPVKSHEGRAGFGALFGVLLGAIIVLYSRLTTLAQVLPQAVAAAARMSELVLLRNAIQ